MRMRTKKNRQKQGKLILDNVDIRSVLDELHIHYTEEGKNVSSGWIGVTCPFCDDQTNHMGVNVIHKTISCFKCGTTGTVVKYLAEEVNSFSNAIQLLGDSIPRELRSFEVGETERAITVELPKQASPQITPYHAGYLKSRNFDFEYLSSLYNLHYCGPISKWHNRIIVPVVRNFRLITFTSVDISDETDIRYKHLGDEESVVPIKDHLFGLEHTDKNSVIVVEGLFDMMRIGPGAVATFGTKITPQQKRLLSKFSVVKILFDGDDSGRVNGERLANDLAPFCDVRIFDLPDGMDPDKLSDKEIHQIKES